MKYSKKNIYYYIYLVVLFSAIYVIRNFAITVKANYPNYIFLSPFE